MERLWENAGVEQAEEVPLRARLGLEVPEDPAAGVLLKDLELGLDVAAHVVLELVAPGFDEVDVLAGADVGRVGVGAVVAGADAVAV